MITLFCTCTNLAEQTLYRSFFASVTAAVTLTAINPRGSDKLTQFTIDYRAMWHWFELLPFILLGVIGGVVGAMYCKINIRVARVRKYTALRHFPISEVVVIAFATAMLKYWNGYTRVSMPQLIHSLFNNQCSPGVSGDHHPFQALCSLDNYDAVLHLCYAGVMYFVIASVTFGAKVPGGLFVPSLTIGAIFGHLVGTVVKHVQEMAPDAIVFAECRSASEGHVCVVPGVYALVGAAAMLGGATRVTVSLAVIMFELTGGLEYVVPIMIASVVSKWIGDALTKYSLYELYIALHEYPYLNIKLEIDIGGSVSDAMTHRGQHLQVIYADDNDIARIKSLLQRTRYHGFPVVESLHSARIVGYISRLRLMQALKRHRKHVDMHTMIVFHRDHETLHVRSSNHIDFSDYLDTSPIQITPTTSIIRMYEMFKSMGLRYCLVCKGNMLLGIITKKDVISYVRQRTK